MAKHTTPHRTTQAGAGIVPVVASSASVFTGRLRDATQRPGRHARD